MDLLDGSDAEDAEFNEDDLLGLSDEEGEGMDTSNTHATQSTGSHPPLVKSEEPESVETEEEFLDLALGEEEELTLAPDDNCQGITPVKVKVRPASVAVVPQASALNPSEVEHAAVKHERMEDSEEQDQSCSSVSKEDQVDEDDGDEDENKGQRSRFHSERPPSDTQNSSSYVESPQPIRTLGDHVRFGNQFHYGGQRVRGNMRARGHMPSHQIRRGGFRGGHGPRMSMVRQQQTHAPQNQHHQPPSSSANRPQFRAPGPEIPISQCSGQIFIDFNQPMQHVQSQSLPQKTQPQTTQHQNPPTSTPIIVPSTYTTSTPLPPKPQTEALAQQQPLAPAPTQSSPKQGVGIVRPQRQPKPNGSATAGVQLRTAQGPTNQRFKARVEHERRNQFFPPPHQRPQFSEQQNFRPPHMQMRPPHPVFIPNQTIFIPQQPFMQPGPSSPQMMGNYSYNGPPGTVPPGMMMRPSGPGLMDYNRFPIPNQGPSPPNWMEQQHYGGTPLSLFQQGMPPHGYYPQPHHMPMSMPMNHYPTEQQYRPIDHSTMVPYAQPQPYHRAPEMNETNQPTRYPVDNRYEDRYRYSHESSSSSTEDSDKRKEHDEYSKHGYKRRQDDEYKRSSKYHRYEDYNSEESTSTSSYLPPTPKDNKTEELEKISIETKKEMGIDDDYMAKMEEQKRKREEILRKKGLSRKKEEPEAHSSSTSPKKHSIYVNPATFKGDLAHLNSHLQGMKMASKASSSASSDPHKSKPKPKTILRVTKNSKGEVIHMEKLLKVEKKTMHQ